MSESSRHAYVIEIEKEKHPDADLLSLVHIDGFTCVINTAQWEGVNKCVYIEPQTCVDVTRPEFSFLKRPDKNRDVEVVTVRKFRGIWSQGLLIPITDETPVGTDLWEALGLSHYEPPEEIAGMVSGYTTSAPPNWASLPKFDLESFKRYGSLFKEGESVWVWEKLNGANESCVFSNGEFHVKSRNLWKKDEGGSDFWLALHNNEPLKKFLQDNPDHLVQGEMTGKVKNFLYGLNGKVEFYAFDIRKPDYTYMNADEFMETCEKWGIKTPRLFEAGSPYSKELVEKHTEGEQWNNPKGLREGVVCRPTMSRFEARLNGRLVLKNVSNAYLEKQGKN